MIDHIGLAVTDAERSRRFYEAALAPLGIGLLMTVTADQTGGITHYGFGSAGKPFLWVEDSGKPGQGTHVAFAVETRSEVDAFYMAALKAGGTDNGAPGVRVDYAPDYYAAFVCDPDGNNIEAVCRAS